MNMSILTRLLITGSLAVAILAGCNAGGGTTDERRYYLLEVTRDGPPLAPQEEATLTVREFSISPRFRDKELVYRTGQFIYESDYYNRFLASAGPMLAEQTRRWISKAGIFAHVVPSESGAQATHVLEGNITSLYGDFRDKSAGKAVMGIEFFLVKAGRHGTDIVFHKAYETSSPLETQSVEGLVEGYNLALERILADLENDLQTALKASE